MRSRRAWSFVLVLAGVAITPTAAFATGALPPPACSEVAPSPPDCEGSNDLAKCSCPEASACVCETKICSSDGGSGGYRVCRPIYVCGDNGPVQEGCFGKAEFEPCTWSGRQGYCFQSPCYVPDDKGTSYHESSVLGCYEMTPPNVAASTPDGRTSETSETEHHGQTTSALSSSNDGGCSTSSGGGRGVLASFAVAAAALLVGRARRRSRHRAQ